MKYNDRIDAEIEKSLKAEEHIPISIQNKKELAFKQIRMMEKDQKEQIQRQEIQIDTRDTRDTRDTVKGSEVNMKRRRWITAASILLIGAISLGTPLMAEIRERLFEGKYTGLETAIDKGYTQTISGVSSESNGIKLELLNVVLDPTMLNLEFKISAEDIKDIKGFKYNEHRLGMDRMTISDDKGRIIQEVREDGVYYPPILDENGVEVHWISSRSEEINTRDIGSGNIYFNVLFHSFQGELQDIEGLKIKTNQLGNLKGDWELDVTIDEEMREDAGSYYTVEKESSKIEVLEAKTIPTGLKLKFIVKAPIDERIVSDTKIVDANGKEYRTQRGASMNQVEGGELVDITFEVTQFEELESFELVIENLEGVDERVKLIKE